MSEYAFFCPSGIKMKNQPDFRLVLIGAFDELVRNGALRSDGIASESFTFFSFPFCLAHERYAFICPSGDEMKNQPDFRLVLIGAFDELVRNGALRSDGIASESFTFFISFLFGSRASRVHLSVWD